MDLNILWLIFITVLFGGFFFLEGFDFGVAALMPALARNDSERRTMINSIGPFWDGNEVWLVTAFGAIFAAFPTWYATMLSGYYQVMFIVIIGLIFRGVSFEFRGKVESPLWKSAWDWAMFIGSVIPAVLMGVLFGGLVMGVPIDPDLQFTGSILDLLHPMAVLAGVFTLLLFCYHGAIFTLMKAGGEIINRAKKAARWTGLGALLTGGVIFGFALMNGLLVKPLALALGALAAVVFVASFVMTMGGKEGRAMLANGIAILLMTASVFAGLFPNVMNSSTDMANSLTIYNASSSPYTLTIMTIITLSFLPFVLIYQIWTYRVFKGRVTVKDLEY